MNIDNLSQWQKKFIKYLFHYSPDRLKIDEAFILKNRYLPTSLYKYRTFSENSIKALEEGYLWLPSVETLNDPYDSKFYFDPLHIKTGNEDVDKALQTAIEIRNLTKDSHYKEVKYVGDAQNLLNKMLSEIQSINPSFSDEKICGDLYKIINELNQKMIDKFNDNVRKGIGVISFSKTISDPLMWSHYADGHKGFAIEYNLNDLPDDNLSKRLCYPVFYTSKLRNATRYIPKSGDKDFNNLFGIYCSLMKNHNWKYEQEWRVVNMFGEKYVDIAYYNLPKPTSIIIGSKISDDNLTWITNFCLSRSIPLKKAIASSNKSNLMIISEN